MDEAEFVQSVNRNGWPFSILNQSCGREGTEKALGVKYTRAKMLRFG